jgi:hypothetical protein
VVARQHRRGVAVAARPRPDDRAAPVGCLLESYVVEAEAGETSSCTSPLGDDVQVILKLVVEGPEEQGTGGLEAFVPDHVDLLRADAIIVADTGNAAVGHPAVLADDGLTALNTTRFR